VKYVVHFDSIDPIQLALLSDAIAIVLAEGNSADDNNVLGNLLVAVGSIMLTIAAQQSAIGSSKASSKDNSSSNDNTK
jgi:hypothetical protein